MTTPVAVYGATGFTGRLIVAELVRRGIPCVLSGRRREALEAVAAEHGLDASVVRPAAHDDRAALVAAFTGCDVVLACAGPFMQVGGEVPLAAIDAGCHYLDTTGEQPFMRRVLDIHGEAARRAGVALVSGAAFDYVPGDLLCSVTADGLGRLSELTLAYAVEGFGPTRGTMRSALLMMAGGDVVWEGNGHRPAKRVPALRERFDFGPGIGPKGVAPYPCGEVLTVPRHVDVHTMRARITNETVALDPRTAPLIPALTPVIAALLRTPLRGVLDRAIGRLPEGPPLEERRAVAYTLVCEAVPAGGGTPVRGTLTGSDIYGITATIIVEAAARMREPGFDRRGGLAPAEAFDARSFLDALAPAGIAYAVTGRAGAAAPA